MVVASSPQEAREVRLEWHPEALSVLASIGRGTASLNATAEGWALTVQDEANALLDSLFGKIGVRVKKEPGDGADVIFHDSVGDGCEQPLQNDTYK